LVQPVEAIGAVCRELETLYLVDACQSVGQRVIDVAEIGCDFLSGTSRKFLRGPRGAGFLYAADSVLGRGLEPLFIDMRGGLWTDSDAYESVPTAGRFENWEFAYALVLGTGAAAEYATAVGIVEIAARATELAGRLRSGVAGIGLRLLDRGAEQCAIVTVEIPGWDAKAFHGELENRGINSAVSTREYAVIDYDAKGVEWAIRLSPHYYNAEEEIDAVVAALREMAR
jgi:selenocysteine lyase/cysteine desulfurase